MPLWNRRPSFKSASKYSSQEQWLWRWLNPVLLSVSGGGGGGRGWGGRGLVGNRGIWRRRRRRRRRRKTFTLEHRPGQTRLVSSGLLGNRQGAWSNLLNSASRLLYISLFLFLCLSRLLTFGLCAFFPICPYLSHPLRRLSPTLSLSSLSLSRPPSLFLGTPQLPACDCVCVQTSFSLSPLRPPSISDLRQRVLSGCAAAPPPYLSHRDVSTALRQARPSVTYHTHTHTRAHKKNTQACKHTHTTTHRYPE